MLPGRYAQKNLQLQTHHFTDNTVCHADDRRVLLRPHLGGGSGGASPSPLSLQGGRQRVLQDTVVKAINQILRDKSSYQAQLHLLIHYYMSLYILNVLFFFYISSIFQTSCIHFNFTSYNFS